MYTTPMCKTCGQRGPHKCFGLIPAFPSNSKKQPLVIQISGKKTIRQGLDSHAQWEIRQTAIAMNDMISEEI